MPPTWPAASSGMLPDSPSRCPAPMTASPSRRLPGTGTSTWRRTAGRTDATRPSGFCNWIRYRDVYLEGGMCVRANFYRRMPRDDYRECARRGGLAQMMMQAASRHLNDCKAWFGFCGDAKALAVDLRAGYELTNHDMLIVKWFAPLPENESQLSSIRSLRSARSNASVRERTRPTRCPGRDTETPPRMPATWPIPSAPASRAARG